MRWVAPTERDAANETLEKRLWAAADQLRANSGLTSAQYSTPVLGLVSCRQPCHRIYVPGVHRIGAGCRSPAY
jgi:hypothetical protein